MALRPAAFLVIATLCSAGTAAAQTLIPAVKGERLFRAMTEQPGGEHLRGKVYSIRTALNLSFRFQTNYYVETPAEQFVGPNHKLAVLLRVIPKGGYDATYLGAYYALGDIPPHFKHADLNVSGLFFLGPGEYTIDVVVSDEKNRVMRSTQHVKAELKGAEKQIKSLSAPGAVGSLASLQSSKRDEPDGKPLRLTLLLHAAPNYFRSAIMRPQDVGRLLGAMSALLDQVNIRSLRVVAFNLDQQKELYRSENFSPESFEDLRQSIEPVQVGTVDYKVLKNQRGHIDLLADLIGRELHAEERSDAVIVLGPTARTRDRIGSGVIEENTGGTRFFYLEYKSMRELMEIRSGLREGNVQGQFPDTIESAMKRVNGKVFHIFTPADFAKAIAEIARRIPS